MRPRTLLVLTLAALLGACMPKAYNPSADPARDLDDRRPTLTDTATTRKDTLP